MWALVILFVGFHSSTTVTGFQNYERCMVEAAKVKHWEYSAKTLCVEIK